LSAPAAGDQPENATTPIVWSRLALPATKLAAVGFSLTLFVQLCVMRLSTRIEFLAHNTLGKAPRTRLLISLAAGAAVALIVGAVLLRRRPRDARRVARVERAASLLAPLGLLFLMVPLTSVTFSHDFSLTYLFLLGAFALMVEPLLRDSLAAARWMYLKYSLPRDATRVRWWQRPIVPFLFVLAGGLAYSLINSHYTILNHHRLNTAAFDLGIYDNLMWNAMHGHPFRSPVLFGPAGGNYIAGHAEFAMMLFVPLYALHPGPEMLLVLQAFAFGMAAVPLYLFAATQLPRSTAAVLAFGYLLFAPLHGPNFYDFHWLPIAMFFHFWLYYAIAKRKTWLIVVNVLILFAIREDVAVGIAVLGLFLLFTRLRPALGLALAVAAGVWFGIDRFVIMPLAGQWWFQNVYNDLFADGEATYVGVIKTILTNPVYFFSTLLKDTKVAYALHMLAPVAFLPLRRLATAIFIIPGAFFTLMTSNYAPVLMIQFQYTSHWIPYLFLAVVIGLVLIERERGELARRAAVATIALALGAHSYAFGGLLQHERFQGGFSGISFEMSALEKQRYQDLRALIAMIPRTASVAATEQEVPHVSTREVIYSMRQPPGAVDYLLVGRSHMGGMQANLTAAFAVASYGLVAQKGDELFLFKRGPRTPGTEAAMSMLGVPPTTAPPTAAPAPAPAAPPTLGPPAPR
jgi:uncharacterized membrane protein